MLPWWNNVVNIHVNDTKKNVYSEQNNPITAPLSVMIILYSELCRLCRYVCCASNCNCEKRLRRTSHQTSIVFVLGRFSMHREFSECVLKWPLFNVPNAPGIRYYTSSRKKIICECVPVRLSYLRHTTRYFLQFIYLFWLTIFFTHFK